MDVDANCDRNFAQGSARLTVSVESSQMDAKGESESDVSKTDLIGMDRLNGRS